MEPSYGQKSGNKALTSVVLLAIVLLGIFYLAKVMHKPALPLTVENVVVTKVDLSAPKSVSKIPAGFPKDLPILDPSTINEGYTLDYKDHGVVLSNLTYTTTKSLKEVYDTYKKYMTGAFYVMRIEPKETENSTLLGMKNNNQLSVVLTSNQNLVTIKLSYTSRK